jgi:hypothetical protein
VRGTPRRKNSDEKNCKNNAAIGAGFLKLRDLRQHFASAAAERQTGAALCI